MGEVLWPDSFFRVVKRQLFTPRNMLCAAIFSEIVRKMKSISILSLTGHFHICGFIANFVP